MDVRVTIVTIKVIVMTLVMEKKTEAELRLKGPQEHVQL